MKQFFLLFIFMCLCALTNCLAQRNEYAFTATEGVFISGYVNQGAYINFTGPSFSIKSNNFKILIGMLPSLRFKKDNTTVKNSFITPNLGVGLTAIYKRFAFQIPFYYNTKTNLSNGTWNIGFGIGMNLQKNKEK